MNRRRVDVIETMTANAEVLKQTISSHVNGENDCNSYTEDVFDGQKNVDESVEELSKRFRHLVFMKRSFEF